MNLFYTVFVIMAGFTFLAVSDRAESLDITKMVQGIVKEEKSDSIKIQDDTSGKEVRIAIDPNTVYDNAQKWTDLKAGDKVQIEYQAKNNKDTAIIITKMEVES